MIIELQRQEGSLNRIHLVYRVRVFRDASQVTTVAIQLWDAEGSSWGEAGVNGRRK